MVLRVTVCELHDEPDRFALDWARLADHVRAAASDLVLLPEMPFGRWFAASPDFDAGTWAASVRAHEAGLGRLADFGPATVVASRPVDRGGERFNEGFAWSAADGYRPLHDKRHLPDEAGYWEARWYAPGDGRFEAAPVAGATLGFLICTELWSLGHAQRYGKAGVQILATPRATGRDTVEKWITGGRAAAIVSGAFSISSNRTAGAGGGDFGGGGWIIDPDGVVLARTTARHPFHTVALDLNAADAARGTYPRYALD